MRIQIRHAITLDFEPAAKSVNAVLRLTPRGHDSQHVVTWRIDVDANCRMRPADDAFGNVVHAFSAPGPFERLRILVEGEVETFDAAGIVRATLERFPPELFLRETALTSPDEALRAIVAQIGSGDDIECLHALLLKIAPEESKEKPEPAAQPPQSQSQTTQRQSQGAVCDAAEGAPDPSGARQADLSRARDLAHAFVAGARLLRVPARIASGYFVADPRGGARQHVWAEAHVDGIGWIGFDPDNAICPHEAHVRVAIGLDADAAAPLRCSPAPTHMGAEIDMRRIGG
jgi:transglutaminase-like putative cysteine protease